MLWHLFRPKELHSLGLFPCFLIDHFLDFLFPDRHLFVFISNFKSKRNWNCDIESFAMVKSILISDVQQFILFPLDPLSLNNLSKLFITGSSLITLSIFLKLYPFLFLYQLYLSFQVLYINPILYQLWPSSIR